MSTARLMQAIILMVATAAFVGTLFISRDLRTLRAQVTHHMTVTK